MDKTRIEFRAAGRCNYCRQFCGMEGVACYGTFVELPIFAISRRQSVHDDENYGWVSGPDAVCDEGEKQEAVSGPDLPSALTCALTIKRSTFP